MLDALRRTLLTIVLAAASGACDPEEVPACPGQCFEHTLVRDQPGQCQDDDGVKFTISFTGNDPVGYHGRTCFNSPSIALVGEAIDHLRAGGQLAELSPEARSAYVSAVDVVRADIEAQCATAAPGQCIDAAQVCTGIAADAYEQLVVEETCVLQLGGVEPVVLGPGDVCAFGSLDPGPGMAGAGRASGRRAKGAAWTRPGLAAVGVERTDWSAVLEVRHRRAEELAVPLPPLFAEEPSHPYSGRDRVATKGAFFR